MSIASIDREQQASLDVEEIEQFCEEQGIPNDAKARSSLAIRKARAKSAVTLALSG